MYSYVFELFFYRQKAMSTLVGRIHLTDAKIRAIASLLFIRIASWMNTL